MSRFVSERVIMRILKANDCAIGLEAEMLPAQTIRRIFEEILWSRKQLDNLKDALSDLYETSRTEAGLNESEVKAWDSSALGNAKGALSQYVIARQELEKESE